MRPRMAIQRAALAALVILAGGAPLRAEEHARKLLREANPCSEPGSGPVHNVFIGGFMGAAPPPLPPGVPRRYEPTFFAVPVGWLVQPFHHHEGDGCRR